MTSMGGRGSCPRASMSSAFKLTPVLSVLHDGFLFQTLDAQQLVVRRRIHVAEPVRRGGIRPATHPGQAWRRPTPRRTHRWALPAKLRPHSRMRTHHLAIARRQRRRSPAEQPPAVNRTERLASGHRSAGSSQPRGSFLLAPSANAEIAAGIPASRRGRRDSARVGNCKRRFDAGQRPRQFGKLSGTTSAKRARSGRDPQMRGLEVQAPQHAPAHARPVGGRSSQGELYRGPCACSARPRERRRSPATPPGNTAGSAARRPLGPPLRRPAAHSARREVDHDGVLRIVNVPEDAACPC